MTEISVKKRFFLIILLIAFLTVLYLAFTAYSIVSYGKSDKKTPSDVAIVLGAGTYNGEVSPVYRERINHGIWLYENGYVDFLIFTGGIGEGNDVSDAYAAKQYAISKSVPENVIFIEEFSAITEENLEYAKTIMAHLFLQFNEISAPRRSAIWDFCFTVVCPRYPSVAETIKTLIF